MNAEQDGKESEEKILEVKWATGPDNKNLAGSKDIFLSPTVMDPSTTKKKSWTEDERMDVLIGEALAQSAMKSTIDPAVEKKMIAGSTTSRGRLENEIWSMTEYLFAENRVLEDYPGFKGYFATNRAYNTEDGSKQNLQKTLQKTKLNVAEAAAGFAWNMLNPSDPLEDIPPAMSEFFEWCQSRLAKEATSAGRSEASKEIVEEAYKKFLPLDEAESSSGSGEINDVEDMGQPTEGRGKSVNFETDIPVDANPRDASKKDPYSVPAALDKSEWRGGTIDYKVPPAPVQYKEILTKLVPTIRNLRARLKIRAEEQRHVEHALKRGRLDEGSLYKLAYSRFDFKDEKIFEQEEILSMPDVAFGLLVDESGSMGGGGDSDLARYAQARNVCMIIAEALRGLPGVQLSVWGHTGQGPYQDPGKSSGNKLVMHQYYSEEHPHIESIARMAAFSQNLDGYAIAHVANFMKTKHASCKKKVLIHISDGYPCADGYGGSPAFDHMLGISKLAKRDGIKVIGVGIDGAFDDYNGKKMYGPGNFVILRTMEGLQNIIANMITRVTNER